MNKFIITISVLVVVIVGGWLIKYLMSTINPIASEQQSKYNKKEEIPTEILLDYTPMIEPISMFVRIQNDGRIQGVYYSLNLLTVTSYYQGTLPGADVVNMLDRTGKPLFRAACWDKNFTGTGLSQGDQFHLLLKTESSITRKCFGFIMDAPVVVQALVEDLRSLAKRVDKILLADAYIRSISIESEHLERLQQKGEVRLALLNEFPLDVQPILTNAIGSPREFLELTRTQYDLLLVQSSHSHEFFIIDNGLGYQLSLFQSTKKFE